MGPEFSRIVNLDDLLEAESVFDIEADEAERGALAARFGLQAINKLAAQVRLKRSGQLDVKFSAEFAAKVVQTCVVTLEPVCSDIETRIDILFGSGDDDFALSEHTEFSLDDDREQLPEDKFDIGEIVAAELSLLLNPYPRQADTTTQNEEAEFALIHEEKPDTPFAALAGLQIKD